jgi:glycosyltransferase involved in cell wall biosynthesis
VRVCLVYDCLFPHTVGGAERWYANLARRLVEDGHEVSYLTLRQWEGDPGLDGVRVVAVGPQLELYARGRRRIVPPLVFGLGVLAHLIRHGRDYDVVHTASFPYFSLLAAAAVRPLHRFRLVVDWHEVWTRGYWREYLGGAAGRAGWLVQALCLRVPQRAFCFSRLHERRLVEEGVNGELSVLEGEYDGPLDPPLPRESQPVVVFAGRHIPEKRAPSLVRAMTVARRRIPGLRCDIFGDGPDRRAVEELVAREGLGDAVAVRGFVSADEVSRSLRSALCMVLPSRREGYGQIVVESAAKGVPSVVCAAPDNAATELVDEGVNGTVAASDDPEVLAEAIVRVHDAGPALRESTAAWFEANGPRLSLRSSLDVVAGVYAEAGGRQR